MRIASGPDRGAHLVAGLCSLHYVSCRNAGLPEWLRSGPLLAMDAHVCSMIAVWVQLAALSAVFRTQTAIMGRTARGRRPYSVGARLPPSSDGAKIAESSQGSLDCRTIRST